MAQVEEKSGGRSTNVDMNLVPFIDLMSVLITFLLITAVWSQVSMIQLGSSIYGKKTSDQITPPPPIADIPLRLDVKDFGFRLVVGQDRYTFERKNGEWQVDELGERLAVVRQMYPDKADATITVDNEVPYEKMVMGMDVLLGGGFSAISIATVESE
ncbi:MAG: biopolymer transporter ExbD [Bdellovibrionales bacterium]|jgi:biopolymer transport protein ExbD|nr:biopolymer transporter ExbD [Bdellovibrionales bacterium]